MDKCEKVLELARRRGFFTIASELYGGVAGFLDFGPLGTLLKKRIEEKWRQVFIKQHQDFIFEIETSVVMPSKVFEASGHVEHFTDFIVECNKCGRKFRADHLIEEQVEDITGLEGMTPAQLTDIIREHHVVCPECGGELEEVQTFNLLFKTAVGPYTENIAYLRPEAAQGMFVNFKHLYYALRERLPLGLAQIGKVFRNEISPRQGPIRLREFTIMEIELFFDPENPSCSLLDRVENEVLRLVPEELVAKGVFEPVEVKVREAVEEKLILTEWQAYFMALATKFVEELGVPQKAQMFIGKPKEERAHYSAQTYDQMVKLDRWGWVEVSGHAYRTDYDLAGHMKFSGEDLRVFKKFPEKIVERKLIAKPRMQVLGKLFKEKAPLMANTIRESDPKWLREALEKGSCKIGGFEISKDCVEFVEEEVEVTGRRFIPHVAEPSFGAERLTYVALEYSYTEREDRVVLKLPRDLAPIQAAVFPLVSKPPLTEVALQIADVLRSLGYYIDYDDSGSIGRRYARVDEVGVPLVITIDYQTLEDDTVTLRDRDTWKQVRVPIKAVPEALERFLKGARLEELGVPV